MLSEFKTILQNPSGLSSKFFLGVGGFPKILRNFQSGSWQMLTSNYKVGGWGKKRPKICLRNILMVPIQNRRFLAKLDILLPFLLCSISFSMSGDFVSKRKPMETKLACMYIYFDIYDFFLPCFIAI